MKAPYAFLFSFLIFQTASLTATDLAPKLLNVTTQSFDADWSHVEGSTFIAVLSADIDFSLIISSVAIDGSSAARRNEGNIVFAAYGELSPLTPYFFAVKLSTEDDASYAVASTVTFPSAPGPIQFDQVSKNSVTLSWSGNGNPTASYEVQYSPVPDFMQGESLDTVSLSARINALSADRLYYFKVRALSGGGGGSSFSETASTATHSKKEAPDDEEDPAPPAPPSGLVVAQISASSMGLIWEDNSNDENGFLILNENNGIIGTVSDNVTVFLITGLAPNSLQNARVAAFNDAGRSTGSNTVSSHTLANVPQNLQPTAQTQTRIDLSWQGNPNTVLYEVTQSTNPFVLNANVSIPVPFSANHLSSIASVGGLSPATTYFFRVRARNGDGVNTAFSAIRAIATLAIPPPPPDTTVPNIAILFPLDGSASSGTISISGTAQDNVSVERVEISIDSSPFAGVVGLSNWSYGLDTLTLPNGSHRVTVRAVDTSSNTASLSIILMVHNEIGLPTPPPPPPFPPQQQPPPNPPGNLSALMDPGVTVLSQSLTGDTLKQILSANTQSKVIYSNQISITLPPGSSITTLATLNSLTVTSIAPVLISAEGVAVKGMGTIYFQNDPNSQFISLSAGPFQNLQVLNPASNGKMLGISLNPVSGEVKTEIPPGAFTEDIVLEITALSGPRSLTQLEITPQKPLQPVRNILISMAYRPESLAGLNPDSLLIARFDEFSRTWIPAAQRFDRSNGRVAGVTNHLSRFQLMASDGFASERIYPNPLRSHMSGHAAMAFLGLRAGGTVKIFTPLGELVRELQGDVAGKTLWDGKNSSGEDVASGGYLALVQSEGGSETAVTIAVER